MHLVYIQVTLLCCASTLYICIDLPFAMHAADASMDTGDLGSYMSGWTSWAFSGGGAGAVDEAGANSTSPRTRQ